MPENNWFGNLIARRECWRIVLDRTGQIALFSCTPPPLFFFHEAHALDALLGMDASGDLERAMQTYIKVNRHEA